MQSKKQPVQVRLRMVRRAVRDVVELRVVLHHLPEHVALDRHEAGRRLRHLDEALGVDIAGSPARAVIDRIERIFGVAILELLLASCPAAAPSAGQLKFFIG